MEDLHDTISRIKPLADTVVEAATALNAAIRAAADQGLTVRLLISEHPADGDDEPIPAVRTRISKRIV
jgi:hypothetical protein